MTIARFKDGLSTVGELIEYPPELEGGRNLFEQTNYSHHSNSGYNESEWTSAVVKIEPNAAYTISLEVTETNRFGVWQDALNDGIYAPMTNELELITFYRTNIGDEIYETVTTSKEGGYLIIYLSNESASAKEELKVEKGNKATPWTPAPEDLGLDYPDWVQNFTTSFSENGIITQEFIEGENTSLSDKIKTQYLREGGL